MLYFILVHVLIKLTCYYIVNMLYIVDMYIKS